jgi:hypothetical protein
MLRRNDVEERRVPVVHRGAEAIEENDRRARTERSVRKRRLADRHDLVRRALCAPGLRPRHHWSASGSGKHQRQHDSKIDPCSTHGSSSMQ